MITFKESKSKVVVIHSLIMMAVLCGVLSLQHIITSEPNYAQLIKDSFWLFFIISIGFGLIRYEKINGDIKIDKNTIIGPSFKTMQFWHNPQVEISLNELADNPLSHQNFIHRLIGIYTINSRIGASILVIAPFYDNDILTNLRHHIDPTQQS